MLRLTSQNQVCQRTVYVITCVNAMPPFSDTYVFLTGIHPCCSEISLPKSWQKHSDRFLTLRGEYPLKHRAKATDDAANVLRSLSCLVFLIEYRSPHISFSFHWLLMLKGTESWFLIWEGIYKVKFRFLISTTLLITFLFVALSIVWLPSFPPTRSIIPILLFICFYYTFWSKARCFFVPTGCFLMTYNKWWCYISVSQQTVQVLQTLNDSLTEINATDIKASETNPAFKSSSLFRLQHILKWRPNYVW